MVLNSAGLKKFIKIVLRANYKIRNAEKKDIDSRHNLESEILIMKEKLRLRAELNKKISEKKKKEFFEMKQAEKIVEDVQSEKSDENHLKILKESSKPKLSKEKEDEIISKINSVKSKFRGSDIDEKKIKLINDKKEKLSEIKLVLNDLENKHKELKGHDPVILLKLDEKINLLKKRISKMEHE